MKKILILVFSLLLVGCSADYTLTIDGSKYKEEITLNKLSDSEMSLLKDGSDVLVDYKEYRNITGEDDGTSYEEVKACGQNCYSADLSGNNAIFSHTFNYSGIVNSTAIHECYQSPRIVDTGKNIVISTNDYVDCFDGVLDNLTINVVVEKYKVISNNADSVSDNKYTWNINKNNYQNKPINMTIEVLDSSVSNSGQSNSNDSKSNIFDLYIDKNLVIFSLIVLVLGGIGVLIYTKISKDDM